MKKTIKLFILLLIMFISSNVYAASVSISASKQNVYVGDSVTVTVNINAGTWNLKVSGAASDSIVGYDMDGNKATSKSYKIDTSSVGTKIVTLTGDISDYETDVTTRGINKSVTINVSQAPVAQTTTTAPMTTTTPTTVKKTTKKTTTKTVTEEITTTTEATTTVPVVESIDISDIKIVGYNIDFKKDIKEYTINVEDNIEELYVIVDGKDIDTVNTGIVNIKDKDDFDIIVKHGSIEEKYKIIIEHGEVKGVTECNTVSNTNYIKIIVILIILVVLLIIVLLYYLLTIKKGI